MIRNVFREKCVNVKYTEKERMFLLWGDIYDILKMERKFGGDVYGKIICR